jgi:hypothetical protein
MANSIGRNTLGLHWELVLALAFKIILLFGLWWMLFRWSGSSTAKPDIAAHFALPVSLSTKEVHHDR